MQAWMELGVSPEAAELRVKCSNAFVPDAAALVESPIRPGDERQFIAELKVIFRKMEDHSEGVQAVVRSQMEKRTKLN